ncbi:MAG: glycosyltransferase family 2 protein, partial [Clostridiaceae bacterium]
MDSKKSRMLSLVVPVYNEQEVLHDSFARMDAAMKSTGYEYEIIYVNDGSRDATMKILREIASAHKQVKVLSFSRNFGHQLAVTCGMDAAKGDALVIIDVDLQDPPELIPQMVALWEQGADIVYGKRVKRKGETFFKKLSAALYYRLLSSMSAYPIPLDTGDFRLIGRNVADVFLRMREHNRFLRGMSAWMGYNAVPIEYERQERFAGKTKYSLKKMLRLASDGITGFSDKPLTLPM